jgi:hypothetical protein
MKKIILVVILLAAAGGALYYYYQRQQPATPTTTSYQQNIVGEWVVDSVAEGNSAGIGLLALALDSNFSSYRYQFKEDGTITQLLNDSILPVKRTYEWKDSAHLVIKETDSVSTELPVQVLTLNQEVFSLMNADSSVFVFKKKRR